MKNLNINDDVRIVDKYSSHYGEKGKFDGIMPDINGEPADRPYRVILNYEGVDYIRYYRKIDIELI